MRKILVFCALFQLCGCVEEPTPREAEKAAVNLEQDTIKERQLSIEEAAEETTKLIEAEAKEEIDELAAESSDN